MTTGEQYNDTDTTTTTTTVVLTVHNPLRRKSPRSYSASSSLLTSSSHPSHQSNPPSSSLSLSSSRHNTIKHGNRSHSRNGITVRILCRCSVVLLMYNLFAMIMVLRNHHHHQTSTQRILMTVTPSRHPSSNVISKERRVHHQYPMVRQTAFTNMVPPPSSLRRTTTTGKTQQRRRKPTTQGSSLVQQQPVTMNLYDIYNDPEEVSRRSMRFPSVEQRLKVYLSTWYIPPCPTSSDDDRHKVQYNYHLNNKSTGKTTVVFQPLHRNNTVSTSSSSSSSTTTTSTLHDLESQQQELQPPRRQLRLLPRMKKRKNPSVDSNDATQISENLMYTVDTTVSHERHLILYHTKVMEQCNDPFCTDVVQFIQPSLDRILQSPSSSISSQSTTLQQQQQKYDELQHKDKFPILFQFGDAEMYRAYVPARKMDVYTPMVPVLRKYRYSITPSDLHQITSGHIASEENTNNTHAIQGQQDPKQCYSSKERRIISGTVRNPTPKAQAIISIVSNYPRHFEPLNHVNDADIAWESKLNMAVYRGALTGRNKADYKSSDVKFCVQVPRCNLVYQHGNSTLVDAMLVPYGKMKYPLSDPLNGVKMFGNSMSMGEMLKYKAIVMLEGNDVSSGLKWALFSNSVVLTQTPTCTSWAMEELLLPWVHYIPINDDLSDVEEKVQWILDHDDEARTIARNGRLWIADLVYHPDADTENEMIIDETMRRYRSHFVYNPSLEV